jgi:hypothetical protein
MAVDKEKLKEEAKHEGEELLWVCGYLWVILATFALQKTVTLAQENVSVSEMGFAFINALALGKVMLIAKQLHFAHHYETKPLWVQTVLESAAFAVLLVITKVVEDTLVEMWKGKSFSEALPHVNGRPFLEAAMLGVVLFVALVPFFAVTELSDQLGPGKLKEIFFRDRSKV